MAQVDYAGQFAGKHAVVTGGTMGIGEATARLFAERGMAGQVICGRSADRGRTVARSLSDSGCETHFVPADLTRVADCRSVVAAADDAFGKVDVLVNVAATSDRGTLLDTSAELFDRIFALNVRAPFLLMQDVSKIMIREKIDGAIVNILSTASYGGLPYISAYSGSKGAMVTLTKNAACSLARHRIRVNGLNNGWTDTPGEHAQRTGYHDLDENWIDEANATQPFGRLIQPEEVAQAVAFLSADDSGIMTGAIVDYDQYVIGTAEDPSDT